MHHERRNEEDCGIRKCVNPMENHRLVINDERYGQVSREIENEYGI
jgi:hypothetical protein